MDKMYESPSINVLGTLSELTLLRKKFGGPSDGIYLVIGSEEKELTNNS